MSEPTEERVNDIDDEHPNPIQDLYDSLPDAPSSNES